MLNIASGSLAQEKILNSMRLCADCEKPREGLAHLITVPDLRPRSWPFHQISLNSIRQSFIVGRVEIGHNAERHSLAQQYSLNFV